MRSGRALQGTLHQIKTFHSQQSNIDLFSKLESSFLQKFFRYNLTDFFPDIFANLHEDVFSKKITNKTEKSVCSSMFLISESFMIEEFKEKMQRFYRDRSKSIFQGELPYAFQFKYCSRNPIPNMISEGQLVFMEVKIKADVQKIQEFPEKISNFLQSIHNRIYHNNKNSPLLKLLQNYRKQYFTIFLVYFGDTNFSIYDKTCYQQLDKITILGRTYKVRIFVFFISRQALIQSFRVLNKISNIEYINDLVIQFYELKREKQRRRRNRQRNYEQDAQIQEPGFQKHSLTVYKIIAVVTLVSFGAIVKKFLL